MSENHIYDNIGYLNNDFRLFHMRDNAPDEFDYHYHDFDKLVLFISGRVEYIVEGVTYQLRPMDLLLVGHHRMHRVIIDPAEPYERVVIYIYKDFSRNNSTDKTKLSNCFKIANERGFCLLRQDSRSAADVRELIIGIERAASSNSFGADVLARAVFPQLMVYINRMALSTSRKDMERDAKYDPRISDVLNYISENLTADLSVDVLAARCYVSRYHFMRRFREMTGSTVHCYVRRKRLLYAATLIMDGVPASHAAAKSGFCDYSTFLRAFRDEFGVLPSEFKGVGISDTLVQG